MIVSTTCETHQTPTNLKHNFLSKLAYADWGFKKGLQISKFWGKFSTSKFPIIPETRDVVMLFRKDSKLVEKYEDVKLFGQWESLPLILRSYLDVTFLANCSAVFSSLTKFEDFMPLKMKTIHTNLKHSFNCYYFEVMHVKKLEVLFLNQFFH